MPRPDGVHKIHSESQSSRLDWIVVEYNLLELGAVLETATGHPLAPIDPRSGRRERAAETPGSILDSILCADETHPNDEKPTRAKRKGGPADNSGFAGALHSSRVF